MSWFATAQKTIDQPGAGAIQVEDLAREHASLLYRVALSLLRHPAEAEDVVQDAFVRVLQHRSKLPSRAEVRPWLLRIAWNLALDRLRRRRAEQMDDAFLASLPASELPADRRLAQQRSFAHTFAAIDRLPAKERQALLLSAVDELSTAEIAAVMQVSDAAVRSLLFRARARLRERVSR